MASSDQQPPVANTNGLMPIVFSYSGSLFSSSDKFASAFSLVPGPAGYFGGGNYYGYSKKGSNANVLSAYHNFALSQALAPIKTAMNSNTSPYQQGLNAALSLWLSNDPSTQVKGIAAPLRQTKAGQTANIALDYLAQSARLYLYYGTGALPGLGVNEQPNFWTNPSWVEFFEPYIASNYVAVSGSYTPSNGVDLTSIEQFAFPLSINTGVMMMQRRSCR